MKKTVELVNLWGDFEEKHPNAAIEDFCRYYLTISREKDNTRELFNGDKPDNIPSTLGKLIVWLSRLATNYNVLALSEINIKHFEEFLLLNSVKILKEPKKTEAIYYNMIELSTGLNFLTSLKERGYITEYDDKLDKRSKRLKLTKNGEATLKKCYNQLHKVSGILLGDMSDEDIQLCILLLGGIEDKFSSAWLRHRSMAFGEILKEMGSKSV
jgi:hypothetical protein